MHGNDFILKKRDLVLQVLNQKRRRRGWEEETKGQGREIPRGREEEGKTDSAPRARERVRQTGRHEEGERDTHTQV